MGFETFLGNPQAVADIRGMLAGDRVPGALLFTGPDGVGKKTLALMLARALNCERRAELAGNFCGECKHCRKSEEMLSTTREDLERRRAIKDASRRVDGLVYFDLQLIEPITRYILIDQIRQLRNVAYTRPFEFPRRIFVIDQAQAVHWQAIDLLLKVMEEPPETTTLILVAPNSHELRSTIRSRCRKVQFLPVEDAVISNFLAGQKGLNKSQQELGVRIADGSISAARTFDLTEYQRRRKPWLDFVEAVATKPVGSMSPADWKIVFDSSKALTENREEFDETLKTGYTLLRDLMQVLWSGTDANVANVDMLPRLKTWAPRLGLGKIEKLKAGLDTAYKLQTRNVNQQLSLDALATGLVESK
jgi:DNA polymerase-3 subunit delta'